MVSGLGEGLKRAAVFPWQLHRRPWGFPANCHRPGLAYAPAFPQGGASPHTPRMLDSVCLVPVTSRSQCQFDLRL